MSVNLPLLKRERLRAEVKGLLFACRLDGAAVSDLAHRYGVSERSVWKARRWVLDHERLTNPTDRRREKRATLHMLDSITTSAAGAGKFREALQGLKLRVELLGLKDDLDAESGPRQAGRSVEDLLEVIGEGAALADRLRSAPIHEDEEE